MIATVVVLGSVIIPDRIPGGSAFDDKKASAAVALASIVSEEGHRGRTELWQKTFDIIADHPILGVGLGNWEFQFPAYADGQHLNVDAAPRRPHNDLLWLASETGLLGLLAYLAMIGLTLATATNIVRHESPERRAIALMAVFVVVAHLVDGMFNFPRERIGGASHFWLAIGTIWLMRPSDPMRMSRLAIASIAIGLLWCTQMTVRRIAYDYHHLRVHVAERDLDWQTVLDHGPKAAGYGNFRANTWIAMGRAKYRTGDPESAIVLHKKALTLHPNSLNAHNNLGIALRMVGRTEEAVIALQRAIQLYPTFVEAQNNLGNALRDLMRIQDSIDVFERVLRQGTAHIPTLHINLARSYIAAGDTIRARGSYSTALKLDPSNSVARRELDALRPKSPSSGLDRS
jgi:tetratricopeptide (TPR) repeat protein